MSARELTTWEFVCDRCGLKELADRLPAGWFQRRGLLLSPGCYVDQLRFLTNRAVMKQLMGDEYRFPDPDERASLEAELAAKGVGW